MYVVLNSVHGRSKVTCRKLICNTVCARDEVAFISVAPTVRLAVPALSSNATAAFEAELNLLMIANTSTPPLGFVPLIVNYYISRVNGLNGLEWA